MFLESILIGSRGYEYRDGTHEGKTLRWQSSVREAGFDFLREESNRLRAKDLMVRGEPKDERGGSKPYVS